MGIGLKKSEQERGGLWPGGKALCKEWRAVMWDYNGTRDEGPALAVTIEPLDDPDETEEFIQYWSAGDIKYLKPSKDGTQFLNQPGSTRKGLNDNTNAGKLLASVFEPKGGGDGFPEDRVEDSLDVFDGTVLVFGRYEQPKREGLPKGGITDDQDKADAKKSRPSTYLLVDEILKFPWEKKERKATGAKAEAAPAKGKAAAAAEDEDEAPAKSKAKKQAEGNGEPDPAVKKKATKFIKAVLADNEDGISKKKLGSAVFNLAKKDEDVQAITELVYDDDFLGDEDAPWQYDADESKVTPLG